MDPSIRMMPEAPIAMDASPFNTGRPSKANCLTQLAHVHRLKGFEENFQEHQYNLSMMILRKEAGLAAPLRMGMELHAARQIKRLPFLQSSNIMEDVLLGRDEQITFSDYLGVPENFEYNRRPHAVVEHSLGIY